MACRHQVDVLHIIFIFLKAKPFFDVDLTHKMVHFADVLVPADWLESFCKQKGVPKLVSGLFSHSLQVINHYLSLCLQARLKYLSPTVF